MLHSRFIAQNASSSDRTRRIDTEHRNAFAMLANNMQAHLVQKCAFTHTGYTGNTDAAGFSDVGKKRIEDFGRQLGVGWQIALYNRNRSGHGGEVASKNSGNVLFSGQAVREQSLLQQSV
jgi:hypothetical protein